MLSRHISTPNKFGTPPRGIARPTLIDVYHEQYQSIATDNWDAQLRFLNDYDKGIRSWILSVSDSISTLSSGKFIEEKRSQFLITRVTNEQLLIPTLPDIELLSPTTSSGRQYQRLLNRISSIRFFSTTLKEDHHSRLLMATAVSQFFTETDNRDVRKRLGTLVHQWESGQDRLSVLQESQIVMRDYPMLFPALDQPFTNYSTDQLNYHILINQNPLISSIPRKEISEFFKHLSFLATIQENAEREMKSNSPHPLADAVFKKTLEMANGVLKVNSSLIKFIEDNLDGSELPVDQPTGVSRQLMGALWRCLIELESPTRTMLGILDVTYTDADNFYLDQLFLEYPIEINRKAIVSCSGRGQAFEYLLYMIQQHPLPFEESAIQIEHDLPEILPNEEWPKLSDDVVESALRRLCRLFKDNSVKQIYFVTQVVKEDYMVETARVISPGKITTHNGITCAYGKLYRYFKSDSVDPTPGGVIEAWYNPCLEKANEVPYAETPVPKEKSDQLKSLSSVQKKAVSSLEALRLKQTLSDGFITSPQSTPLSGSNKVFFDIPFPSIDSMDTVIESAFSPASSITIPGTPRIWEDPWDQLVATPKAKPIPNPFKISLSSILSNSTPDSNGPGFGHVAKSCFGCRFNKGFLAESLGVNRLEMTPQTDLKGRRVAHHIWVTPSKPIEPSKLDTSFEEYGTPSSTYGDSESANKLRKDREFIRESHKELQDRIDVLNNLLKAFVPPKGSKIALSEADKLLRTDYTTERGHLKNLLNLILETAKMRGIKLGLSQTQFKSDRFSKNLFGGDG